MQDMKYINIVNFDHVVLDKEQRTGSVFHTIHELNNFLFYVEAFRKRYFPETFNIVKANGARLNMYVLNEIEDAFTIGTEFSKFANKLISYLNREVTKYKTLIDFSIQIGHAAERSMTLSSRQKN